MGGVTWSCLESSCNQLACLDIIIGNIVVFIDYTNWQLGC